LPIAFFSYLLLLILHCTISKHTIHPGFSILYFVLGIAALAGGNKHFWKPKTIRAPNRQHLLITKYLLLALILGFWITAAAINISHYPLNYKEADMLPVINHMSSRFLHGQQVYAPVCEIWGGTKPVYLPAVWLPYTLPNLLNIDIRWLNIACISACFVLLFSHAKSLLSIICAAIISFLLLYYFVFVYAGFIRFTEEPLICFYYMMLVHFISKNNWRGTFLFIVLCLFSRYWLVLWLPFLFLFSITSLQKQWFSKIWPALILSIIFLLLIPVKEYHWLLSLPSHYTHAVADPGNAFKYDGAIQAYGVIKFFSREHYYLLPAAGAALALLMQAVYYFQFRKCIGAQQLILMLAASVFTANIFSIIPYEYLFVPALFMLGRVVVAKVPQ
jgi:hypothetical protein